MDDQTPPRVNARFPTAETDPVDFINEVNKLYGLDVEADRHNIEPARQDIQFVIGDQWNLEAKARRDRLKKPVLTVNRLPAFVAQYIGAWLQNDTTVRVVPARGGSKKIAEIRQGIIRTITRTREAKHSLHKAMENGYICGVGNFKVSLRDAENDVFTRDIVLEAIGDPFGVIWDRASKDPTGADAQHCFVTRYMTRDDFDLAYPEAWGDGGWAGDMMDYTAMTGHGWEIDEMVRVCEFWQMRKEPVTLALEAGTGDVIDVTGWDPDRIAGIAAPDQKGRPMVRETMRPYAECHVITSTRVLEGPYRLDISRLPVFRVEGWSLQEANVRYRWGFVRNAKDPQRLHNYWRSILAEELLKSASSKWLLDKAASKNGIADQFRNAHLSGDNVLFWDSQNEGAPPQFIPPPNVNQAVLTEAGMTVQDIKDVTNRHEASLGQTSNEVSGRAITARQRVSELGDAIYVDNMNAAIAEAGKVINELIPVVYDTNRTVKVTGDDDVELLQEINGDAGDATPDITVGKYDITFTTGPSYATKRQEAVDVMMTLMNTMPQVGNVIADIIVQNMDIPGADRIAERLAAMLPPGLVDPEEMSQRKREQFEAQQQAQQVQQQEQKAIAMAQIQSALAKEQAETAESAARRVKALADARLAASKVGVDAFEAEIKAAMVQIDALEAGVHVAEVQSDSFRAGLESAARVQDREAAAEAAKMKTRSGEKNAQ